MYSFKDKTKSLKQGWYFINEQWFLTEEAVRKEFNLTKGELSNLFVLAYRECKHIEMKRKENHYNLKKFDVYCFDDIAKLISPSPSPCSELLTDKKQRDLTDNS